MSYSDPKNVCKTPAAKRIVAYLLSQDKPAKHSEIAQALGLALNSVNSLVGELRRHGYLERVVRVTDNGRVLLLSQ
jgi:Mn-dependent DtxR family transcriptional regulator